MSEVTPLSELVQTDDLITDRDHSGRWIFLAVASIILLVLGYFVGALFDTWFHFPKFLNFLGPSIGIALGVAAVHLLFSRSFIDNGATIGLVTVNRLASLFKLKSLKSYGPGKHVAYPWEYRSAENVVNLEESPVSFTVEVQCQDGKVGMRGATRLRADITRMPQFISGAAAVADNVKGLMISESVNIVGPLKVQAAVQAIKDVNSKLEKEFKHGSGQSERVSRFEERFGVIVGDTTIESILPSKEIQETMGTVTEMTIINQIVAQTFGKENIAEVEEMITNKLVTRDEVNRVRTQVLAASGNLQGMDLKDHRTTLDLKGLEQLNPEAARLFGTAFATAAAFMSGRQGGQSQGRGRSRTQGQQGGNT